MNIRKREPPSAYDPHAREGAEACMRGSGLVDLRNVYVQAQADAAGFS
jgi:hypothetical protein